MSAQRVIRQRDVPSTDSGDLDRTLPAEFSPVLKRILLARGIQSAEQLSLALRALHSPKTLGGSVEAARLLADAIEQDQTILVVGDFDADGATGTALALLALRAMGCRNVEFRVPNRFEFGYGLTRGLVDTLSDRPPDIILTVDSGISCLGGVARARQLGCVVIITDHHLPGETLPDAHAIVNPNLRGDEFPGKATAGVGVMFYLLSVLRQELRQRGWFTAGRREPVLAQWLDLVALGTVADLVPLDHNNRVLVSQGLERIRQGQARPGLLALLRLGKRDYRFANASDLGFAVGPRLNAAGRLEDMGAGIACLLEDDPGRAMERAAELDSLNSERKTLQSKMQEEAMQQVNSVLERIGDAEALPNVLVLHDAQWHQGVVGLVASRVKDSVHRPVIAFAPEEPGSTTLKGSARSVRGLHIRDVLALVDSSHEGLVPAFGGHAMAAGLSLESENLEVFRAAAEQAVDSILDGEALNNEVLTDGGLDPEEIGLALAQQIESLGPWGQKFPEPLFDDQFRVIDARVVGGAHLKMVVQHSQGGPEVDAIAFGCLPEDLPGNRLPRFLYRLSVNRWRGSESCQLMVESIVN